MVGKTQIFGLRHGTVRGVMAVGGKRYEVSVLYGAQKTETNREGNKARRKKKAMRNEVSGDTELCWCGCCGAIAGWAGGRAR
jgi:hypothetical protein